MDDWEGYKPRLRNRALDVLVPKAWTEAEIGSGTILQRTVEAVEIEANNLVVWRNRRSRRPWPAAEGSFAANGGAGYRVGTGPVTKAAHRSISPRRWSNRSLRA